MGDPVLGFSSNTSQIMREFDKLHKEMGKLKEANQQLANESKQGAHGAANAFSKWGDELKHMAVGYLTVHTAMHLVTQELEQQHKRREEAATATLKLADAERNFFIAAGVKTLEDRKRIAHRMEQEAGAMGIPAVQLYQSGMAAFSASAGLPEEMAWKGQRPAGRLFPHDTAARASMGAAIPLIVMAGKGISEAEATGAMLKAQSESAVEDPSQAMKYAARAIPRAVSAGATTGEAASLFAAFSKAMSDREGARTSLAVASYTRQLEGILPEKDRPFFHEDPDTGQAEYVGTFKGTGMKTFAERQAYIKSLSPMERARLRSMMRAKESFTGAFDEMMGVRGQEKQFSALSIYNQLAAGETAGSLAGRYEAAVGVAEAGAAQQTAGFSRKMEESTEALQTGDQTIALAGVLEEKAPKLLRAAGQSAIAEKFKNFRDSISSGSQVARKRLSDIEEAKEALLHPMVRGEQPVSYTGFGAVYSYAPTEPTNVAKAQAEKLGEVADSLRRLIELQEKTANATTETAHKQGVSGAASTNTQMEGN